jgi:hypothetical protein
MSTAHTIGAQPHATSPHRTHAHTTADHRVGSPTMSARAVLPALRGVAVQAGLLVLAAVAYLAVRAITQGDPSAAEGNAYDILHLERVLGLDWERGAQRLVLDNDTIVSWFNAVYVWAFWPFLVVALVVLYVRDRSGYAVLRNAMFVSGGIGLVVFAIFPVAPPRFLDGFTDTVALVSGQDHLAHPSAFSNEYAAVPSFHVGWTVLAALALLPVLRHPVLRVLALGQGALMAVTVVVTANHYVVDGVIGVTISVGALLVARRWHERRPVELADPGAEPGLGTLLVEAELPEASGATADGQVGRAA